MLVCYLDDSGKNPQSAFTCLAGYVALEEVWAEFEKNVEPIFQEYKVPVLHTKELHHSDGPFKGWTVARKQAFVFKICREMTPLIPLGVAMAASKAAYRDGLKHRKSKRTVSPYTHCFTVAVNWLTTDVRVGHDIHAQGLAFILEQGHQNNAEAGKQMHGLRKKYPNDLKCLRSISEAPKEECRAIQMADLLAFYTRRMTALSPGERRIDGPDTLSVQMVNIIRASVPHRSLAAEVFGDDYASLPGMPGPPLPGLPMPRLRGPSQ